MGQVLVLNASYEPLNITSWRRAVVMVLKGKAEGLEHDGGRQIRSDLMQPTVIRLRQFVRVPYRPLPLTRRNLFQRDGHRCQYCGQSRPMSQLSLDHVMPRSQGGKTTWENVVCSCVGCNSKKGGRTPTQAGMKLLSDPVRPSANPGITVTLKDPRYSSWKTFLASAGTIT